MMFTGIVSMLFPIYILGCLIAISLSWSKKSFLLSASYSYILITFQLFITGRAQEFGVNTFLFCIYAQLFMGFCALLLGNKTIPLGSLLAIAANVFEALMFTLNHPFRDFYFITINSVQAYQILTLIVLSPGMRGFYRFLPKRKELWKAHLMEAG